MVMLGELVTVEVAFPSSDPRGYGSGTYGSGDYGGASVWTRWEAVVEGITRTVGRERGLTQCDTGVCTVMLRDVSPAWSPPNVGPTSRPMRLVGDDGTGPRVLFSGVVDTAELEEDADGRRWRWTCIDALGVLAGIEPAAGELDRPRETARARIGALLAYAGGLPHQLRCRYNPWVGGSIFEDMFAFDVAARDNVQPLSVELGTVCDSIGMVSWVDPSGVLIVDAEPTDQFVRQSGGRSWVSNVQGDPAAANSLGHPLNYAARWSRADVRNDVAATDAETSYAQSDAASIDANGRRTYQRRDLMSYRYGGAMGTSPARYFVQGVLRRYAPAVGRLVAVTFDVGAELRGSARQSAPLLELLANVNPVDYLTVTLPPDDSGRYRRCKASIAGLLWELGPTSALLTCVLDAPLEEL